MKEENFHYYANESTEVSTNQHRQPRCSSNSPHSLTVFCRLSLNRINIAFPASSAAHNHPLHSAANPLREEGNMTNSQTVFQDNNLVRIHMLEHALKDARHQCELHPSPQNLVEEMVVTAGIHAFSFQSSLQSLPSASKHLKINREIIILKRLF